MLHRHQVCQWHHGSGFYDITKRNGFLVLGYRRNFYDTKGINSIYSKYMARKQKTEQLSDSEGKDFAD
jgi:hypothetical protein